jgi:hypothetical protein
MSKSKKLMRVRRRVHLTTSRRRGKVGDQPLYIPLVLRGEAAQAAAFVGVGSQVPKKGNPTDMKGDGGGLRYCDDRDKRDLRGTSLHEVRFFVSCNRAHFAGTCHVIPYSERPPDGAHQTSASHSDEIRDEKKKVQLKLAIRDRPWENRHVAKPLDLSTSARAPTALGEGAKRPTRRRQPATSRATTPRSGRGGSEQERPEMRRCGTIGTIRLPGSGHEAWQMASSICQGTDEGPCPQQPPICCPCPCLRHTRQSLLRPDRMAVKRQSHDITRPPSCESGSTNTKPDMSPTFLEFPERRVPCPIQERADRPAPAASMERTGIRLRPFML